MPELILAGDPDLEDLYLCEVVKPADHLAPNPLVRVLRVLRYPIQHAIMLPDVVNENAPIPEGTVCRLTALGEPHPPLRGTFPKGEGLCSVLTLTYAESLRKAQEEYISRAPPEEQLIVRRHMCGDYRKKRVVIGK